jgi:hypothetical protein
MFKTLILAILLVNASYGTLATNMYDGDLTGEDLANYFVGSGIAIDNVSFSGTQISAGLYENATVESQNSSELIEGIVLSTGSVSTLNANINTLDRTTTYLGLPHDPDMQSLSSDPYVPIYDATVLEFDITPEISGLASLTYVFGSEEYSEHVGGSYSDVFGCFIDGKNIATVPGTDLSISINNINLDNNPEYYNDNPVGSGNYMTEMDGFTTPLTSSFNVIEDITYRIKLGIADVNDLRYDSWVMLGKGSFKVKPICTNVPEPGAILLIVCGVLFLAGVSLNGTTGYKGKKQ